MARPKEQEDPLTIAGAGPAGLAAAITLARAGRRVEVHEACAEVGHRFGHDLQGLENWTTRGDVIDELRALGISTEFAHRAWRSGVVFDAWRRRYPVRSDEPLFYMLARGPREGTLDRALLHQARSLGVEIRFNSRIPLGQPVPISAHGPSRGDAIAVGYHFQTDFEEGFWVICDQALAPGGYAYLLVMDGHATLKSCMFADFHNAWRYARRAATAFRRLIGIELIRPGRHGGTGNFRRPPSLQGTDTRVAGEQAGFQDCLWGFGIRVAIRSGILAAQSILGDTDYETLWRSRLAPGMRASVVNRALYGHLGNGGYRWLLGHFSSRRDLRETLRRHYRTNRIARFIEPWARAWWDRQRRPQLHTSGTGG